MALDESVRAQIETVIATNRVVLFMKGTRQMPQCGFSAQVVRLLDEAAPSGYETVDVLRSQSIREGIKEYSQWPTIPQLYVDGQFIGGCDIVQDLKASGELDALLGGTEAAAVPVPNVTVSERAATAFGDALGEVPGEALRVQINPQFEHDLFLGPPQKGDVEVRVAGLVLLLDRASAKRANGLHIDFIEGEAGGFKLENPNQPPSVRELGPADVKARLERGELTLFDVRPEAERSIAHIEPSRSLDQSGQEYLFGLDPEAPVAFYCHHGVRSRAVAEQVLRRGFKNVYNLQGGIDAWSSAVDPSVPRY